MMNTFYSPKTDNHWDPQHDYDFCKCKDASDFHDWDSPSPKDPLVPQVNLEAAAILMSVEKLHSEKDNDCSHCPEDSMGFSFKYPCPTLLATRSVASQSTIDYVAEQLKEGK